MEIHLLIALSTLWFLPPFYSTAFDVKGSWTTRWWFGATVVGLIAIISHAIKTPRLLNDSALLFFLTAGILKAFYGRVTKKSPAETSLPFPLGSFLLMLPLLLIAYLHVLSRPLTPADWDSVSLWYKKIKMLYAWYPLKNTRIADWGGNYINYPHLGPMLETLILKVSGIFHENFGRLLFPTVYVLWILSLGDLFKPDQKKWRLFLPPFLGTLFFQMRACTNGYQEVLITTLAGVSAIQLCLYLTTTFPRQNTSFNLSLFLGCFFAGMLAFVKSEGMLLALIIVGTFTLSNLSKNFRGWFGTLRGLFPYLLLTIVLILLWPGLLLWNKADLSHLQNNSFTVSSLSKSFYNLSRASMIGDYFAQYFAQKRILLGFCALLSFMSILFSSKTRRPLTFLWILLITHGIMVALPYFATAADPVWHLRYSFDRLMFQHLFVYPTILCVAVSGLVESLFQKKESTL